MLVPINSIKYVLYFLIYTFPYLILFRVNKQIIQVETIVFFLFLIITIIEFLTEKISFSKKSFFSYRIIIMLWFYIFLTILSLSHTSNLITGQLEDLSYWVISLLPLVFTKFKKREINIVRIILISSFISSIITIFLKIISQTMYLRSYGFMNNANLAGTLYTLGAILSLGLFLQEKDKYLFIFFLVNLIAVFATGSRESLISLILGLLGLGILTSFISFRKSLKWLTIFIVITIISIFFLSSFFPDMLLRYTTTITRVLSGDLNELNLAFSGRPVIWNDVIQLLKENPFKPYGFLGLRNYIEAIYAHNMYLQAWVIGGVLGLFIFIVFIFDLFRIIYKNYKEKRDIYSIILLSIYVPYVFTGVTSDHFLNFFSWNMIFFSLIRYLIFNNYLNKDEVIYK